MNLLITPPFDSPIPPFMLDPEAELRPILEQHDIRIVADPAQADLELVGQAAAVDKSKQRLPRNRVVVMDGEPPQPEFLLPFYSDAGYAAVFTPANLMAYDSDCMAFHAPPPTQRAPIDARGGRVVQLATYRQKPGNTNLGQMLTVDINHQSMFSYRVLCNLRVQVGMAMKSIDPDLIDLYGRNWPEGVATQGNSRGQLDFLEQRHQIAANYAFDLCWENMEIPHYVSEKFWSPVQSGVLPIYWGPADFHAMLPRDTIIDARSYHHGTWYDVNGLVYDIGNMTFDEYQRRLSTLMQWHDELPHDAALQSHRKMAHKMAKELVRVASSIS